ncbi:MAG: hypothetical protein IT450_08310 [Phycisphaerales bacterium]|nr:hypothetical protein [Phycisphaerales bacterium]
MTTLTIVTKEGTSLTDLVALFPSSLKPRLWRFHTTVEFRITINDQEICFRDTSKYFEIDFFEPERSMLRERFGDHPSVFEIGMARKLAHFRLTLQAIVNPSDVWVYSAFGHCCCLVEFLKHYEHNPNWDWTYGQGGFELLSGGRD